MGYASRPPLTKCKNFSRRYSDPVFSGKDFEVSEESSSEDDDDDDDGDDDAIKSQSGQGFKRKVRTAITSVVFCVLSSLWISSISTGHVHTSLALAFVFQ